MLTYYMPYAICNTVGSETGNFRFGESTDHGKLVISAVANRTSYHSAHPNIIDSSNTRSSNSHVEIPFCDTTEL